MNRGGTLKAVILMFSLQVPFFIPPPDGFPLVVLALAFGKGNGHFDFSLLKVNFHGDQRQSSFIDFADQPFDFKFMQKEFAGPQRIMVAVVGKGVGTDVHLVYKYLALVDLGVGIFQIDPAVPQ